MGLPAGQFRALEPNQLEYLGKKLDKIGSELENLNTTMSRLVDILDEITQAEEDQSGSPEQGPSSNTHSTISTEG